MSFFKQFGKVASAYTQLTTGTLGPVTLITPGTDEWVHIYGVTVTSNDTALQTVTVDDGINVINVYNVGLGQPAVLDIATVPSIGRKGGAIRVTAAAVSATKAINIKINCLISKT